MKWLIPLLFSLSSLSLSQTISSDINSRENILLFADHLYCEQDFLRAVLEYDKIIDNHSDSLIFKTGMAYLNMGKYQNSIDRFNNIDFTSQLYDDTQLQKMKLHFLMEKFELLRQFYSSEIDHNKKKLKDNALKLNNFSYLFTVGYLPDKEGFLFPFGEEEKKRVENFYDWKFDPPYKSSALAGIMSAVIPGSGKMYADEWGDGITAFIVTGLFAFLAYDNFKADHRTRAWIFTGIGAFFYAGNIYGSVAATQIYNARITFEFNDGLNLYLQHKNYFTPEYEYCDKK